MASIAAVLEERGFTVKITDAGAEGVDLEGVKGILKDFSPAFLVINSTTPTIENDLPMSGMAKQIVPGLTTIAFGIQAQRVCQVRRLFRECTDLGAGCVFPG